MSYDLNQLLAFVWSGWIATWPTQLLALIWLAWVVSSIWGRSGPAGRKSRSGPRPRNPIAPRFLGGLLLTPWVAQALGIGPLWNLGNGGTYMLAGVTVAGTLFTWWARPILDYVVPRGYAQGRPWVVDTGP